MADVQGDGDKRIRRLRKKLRQIEVLEYSNRQLNHEELLKLKKKDSLRVELNDLLKALESEKESEEIEDGFTFLKAEDIKIVDTEEMKRRASETQDEDVPEIKKTYEPETDINSQPSASESQPESQPEVSGGEIQSVRVVNSEKDSEERSSKNRIRKLRASLENSRWRVRELEGHEDLILDCDILDNLAVTASRDTTVKVWNISSGSLVQSMRGHSGAVTGVTFLDTETAARLVSGDIEEEEEMVVSAGSDCSVRVWGVTSGRCLRSIYTYNGVTRLGISPDLGASVTATDGGKLELYSLERGACLLSEPAHSSAVSALSVLPGLAGAPTRVITADSEGSIRIFAIKKSDQEPTLSLSCVFISEREEKRRAITSIYNSGSSSNLYYGDSGSCLKTLDWRRGLERTIPNHTENIGFTDCVAGSGDLLATSNYDIDTGCGGVNIWCPDISPEAATDLSYVVSLGDGDTGRIVSLGMRRDEVILTGGRELKIWTRVEAGNTSEDVVAGNLLRMFPQTDGGSTGASESELSDEEEAASVQSGNQSVLRRGKNSGFCNCSLM